MAVHHGGVELVGLQLAIGGDQHIGHHAQAVHIRVQRAQAIGELLRQHGDHAARKVDAGRTVVGIDVDGIAVLHIVAYIGNRHQQAPALGAADFGGFAVHGIVKVARILAVDGDQRDIGQVDAGLAVGQAYLVGQLLGQRQALVRELMGHAIFAHRNLDFHAGVVDLAQHLDHAAHGLAEQGRRLGQFDHDDLAGLGGADRAIGDQHILAVALVFRSHEPDAAFLQQAANDGLRRALDDFNNATFGTSPAVGAHDAGADPIAVQYGAHFIGRDVDVALVVIPDHKAVAFTVALDYTFNFF